MARAKSNGWVVYLLRCSDGTLYCGVTNNLERRLAAHGRGAAKYTRGRLPVELSYCERARDRSEAQKREAAWKRLSRAAKLAMIRAGAGRPRRARPAAGTARASS